MDSHIYNSVLQGSPRSERSTVLPEGYEVCASITCLQMGPYLRVLLEEAVGTCQRSVWRKWRSWDDIFLCTEYILEIMARAHAEKRSVHSNGHIPLSSEFETAIAYSHLSPDQHA